jgi:tetratricopeptide (TPR) repeat protein
MPVTRSLATIAVTLLSPLAAQTIAEQGVTAFRNGHYVEACRLLGDAVTRNPHDDHSRTYLALARAGAGNCAAAVPDLAERFAHTTEPGLARLAGLALVQCYVAAGDTGKAIPVALQLESKYPDDADVLYQAARLHMRAFNEATRRMFQKTPDSYRVNQLSAEIFETENRFAEAAAEYRKAIAKNPQTLDLHYRLGRAILLRSHEPEALSEAQKEFAAELALNPADAAAEFQIGQILNVRNQPADALPHFQRALELSPDFVEAALAVAKLHIAARQYAEALPLLERVVSRDPRNEAAHYTLMLAYRDSGELEKAKREQQTLDNLHRAPEGEFTDFLKRIGEKQADQ